MDRVGQAIERWARIRPELDTSGMAIAARLTLLESATRQAIEGALAPHDLSPQAYSVLAVLRSHGAPKCELTPSAISSLTLLTSGGISNILLRLEEGKLVTRTPNPDDGRGVVVRLTSRGKALADSAVEDVLQAERQVISGLTESESASLTDGLARLAASLQNGL